MAISAALLDRAQRRYFYRQNRAGVPVQLPWDQLTIDTDSVYYEPVTGSRLTDKGVRQRGQVTDVVWLPKPMDLPRPATGRRDAFGVWFHGGI